MIYSFPSGPLDTNAYVFVDDESQEAFIVDPGFGSFASIQKWLQRKEIVIQALCITHSHWDHVGDIHLFLDAWPKLPVYVHPLDQDNLEHPGIDGIPAMLPGTSISKTHLHPYPNQVEIGSFCWHAIHTPGHSPGCICLFEPNLKLLFSGDTLFQGTYGLTSLPTSSKRDMVLSLQKLSTLPEDTIVYPGHGPSTTIGKEKSWIERVVAAQINK